MPLTMPARPGFVSSRFGLMTNTQTFTSPFTRNVQRVGLAGARWEGTFTLPPMRRIDAANWQAFLLSLEGQLNTFYGYDPDARTPRGRATGTPLVNGGSQTGSTLVIDGATAGVTNWLMPGDYFAVNGELKMVTAPVNTDGGGNATISFKPALRSSPADNAAVTVTNAACEMILTGDAEGMWDADRNGNYSIQFSGVEAI